MFSGNKNKLERKRIKPLYLAEGGFSLTPPGSSFGGTSTSSKTKTTVPFPKTAKEYMTTIGANPKYKNLDSSKILQLYSKDKSTWPKSLDIIEENCAEAGTCGKTLKYSIVPTPATYNWSSRGTTTAVKPATTTTAVKPKTPVSTSTTPVSTAKTTGTTPVSTPTVIPTTTPVVPPVEKTPVQTTAPARPYLMQGFNYMTPEDRQRAVQFYKKIENVPDKVDIYQLRRDVPKVGTFKAGGQTKNDRAMVSGVSSILRKIKDKKNRKEVAGDMVNQFNREGVNYNKEKFLKNSRSFQGGGTRGPIYVSDRNDPRFKRYSDSLYGYNLTRAMEPLFRADPMNETLRRYHGQAENFVNRTGIKPTRLITYNGDEYNYRDVNIGLMQEPYLAKFKKPVQPVVVDPLAEIKKIKPMGLRENSMTSSISGPMSVNIPMRARKQLPTVKHTNNYENFDIKIHNTPGERFYREVVTPMKKEKARTPPKHTKNYSDEPGRGYKSGGQHGGLDRWFAEKWVDVKSGKPCGRQEGESRAYPACRPSKRVSSKTPKTSSELSSKEKARFKATKTSSQRIPYNHKRK